VKQHIRAIAAVIALTPFAGARAVNLLENGGFETLGPGGDPAAWELDAAGSTATTPVRTGSRSLALTALSPAFGIAGQSDPFSGGGVIPATPGVTYELSVFAQNLTADTLIGTRHRAGLELFFFNDTGDLLGLSIVTIFDGAIDGETMPQDTWVRYTAQLAAPEDATGVGITLVLETDPADAGRGTLYFDDAQLRVVPAPGAIGPLGLGAIACRRRRG